MSLNIQFQNLPSANNEILKAFNSQIAAKALESYQPLDVKERKREKLKALQILKQSSGSVSIADISLTTDSLSASLAQVHGATLQAMLNLLSAKMIEQNKYILLESQHNNTRARIQEKLDQENEDNQEQEGGQGKNKKQKRQKGELKQKIKVDNSSDLIQEIIKSISTYLNQLKQQFVKTYNKILDAFTLKQIREAYDESIKLLAKYIYAIPVEFIDEKIIEPIYQFPGKVQEFLDLKVRSALSNDFVNTFSAEDIKVILRKTMPSNDQKLGRSIIELDVNKHLYDKELKTIREQRIPNTGTKIPRDLRLALHNRN